ncbi:hypothetical protein COT69_02660 [candidate division WWE3 bacterium CG09_land_8_20_14_0_10_39_24]|uniref:DUF4012 domain-containing protein n=2 Tax=Katanobacteria TaxID=422282 RepID=A0A2G9XEU8_UNCKA|nr:MAG: hypothetical protein AUJ94_00940 [bacterium CG2_30_40_12]OJI08404.1 MAG: hypothetical protein BK003_02515 [bacterium CG09_39_24]PIP04821.1 MAG: hypothetical protein COX53_00465 [candidate division WWE3 bacterium CG23_combo_of_CG06-09_8_20_14_all_40_14]PIS12685.1 MAG: hypothetical protein COT69_02660 [candidate division WWE3 bacterium CG09_land_8_20_14_0_10_39_24]
MKFESFYTAKNTGILKKITSITSKLPSGKKVSGVFSGKLVPKKVKKILVFSVLGVVGIFLIILLVVGIPLMGLYKDALALKSQASSLKQAAKEQDLTKMRNSLTDLKGDVAAFESKYEKRLYLIKNFPVVKDYYKDGKHILKAATYGLELGNVTVGILEPFAGDLGFKVEGRELEENELTNQERLIKILKLLPEFTSEIDKIAEITRKINEELSQINETKYPESIRGIKVRSQLSSLKTVSQELAQKSPQFKELFTSLPILMGIESPKVYMVLMANNYELRMSGGFNTFLVLFKIDKGVPEILSSMDTYDIDRDQFYMVNFNVPYYIRDYLRVSRLYARDATSTSPDFVEASDKFVNEFWRKNGMLYQKLDGILQVDNYVVEDLLRVLGPVDSGGYSVRTDEGNYIGISIKEFNSENVILELEKISGGDLSEIIGRKDIIKYLMNSIMQKALNASTENLLPLSRTVLSLLGSKDIIIRSFDADLQKTLEDLGYAGRVTAVPENLDYLHVNNSNFGAGKRDWIIKRKVVKEVYEEQGQKFGVVALTIINPKSPEWWQWVPFYNDYFRFYVPKGSKLISATASDGQELNAKEYEHLGKTVFEGFFKMKEDSSLTVTYKYSLPQNVDFNNYAVLVQKQPGTRGDIYEVKNDGFSEKFELTSDKTISIQN